MAHDATTINYISKCRLGDAIHRCEHNIYNLEFDAMP